MPLKTTAGDHGALAKGRGASINPEGRFEIYNREATDDGWFQEPPEGEAAKPKTVVAIEHAKSVISRHNSPDVGFSQSINPYRGCEHACSYCIAPDTPILMGNGRTLPISELRVGDEIYGTRFDGKYRRYVKSRVLAHWSVIKPAFRTTLEDGSTLVTSGDHRFLTERGWKFVADTHPVRRPHLTTNNRLMGTGQFAEGPCETDEYRRGYLCGMIRGDGHLKAYVYRSRGRVDDIHGFRLALIDPEALLRTQDYLCDYGILTGEFEFRAAVGDSRAMHGIRTASIDNFRAVQGLIAWPASSTSDWAKGFLAGIFDAEGSFSQTILRISNTDREIIGRIQRCLEMFGFRFAVEHQPHSDRKPIDVVRLVGGLREHLRFFHLVRPAINRKLNIVDQAIQTSGARLRVVNVEALGRALRLFDITTSTEDFIANGVVSHNCFARPSHAYLGLSPGLDFETRLSVKVNAAEKLREEFAKPGYRCEPLTVGVNTDAYQPIEREHRITRSILEVASETHHPVSLITKSALIERDLDILIPMAKRRLVTVTFSITTLSNETSRHMEPRTSAPMRRLLAVKRLSEAGIPVNVNVAPVIPFLTDHELEPILEQAAAHGAKSATYILVRLPWEVKDIFRDWLEKHFPLKAAHVMSRIHQMRDGKDNDPGFGSRMVGTGLFAELLKQRFEKAIKRFGLNEKDLDFDLDTSLFVPPSRHGQKSLF